LCRQVFSDEINSQILEAEAITDGWESELFSFEVECGPIVFYSCSIQQQGYNRPIKEDANLWGRVECLIGGKVHVDQAGDPSDG
jgi:hypothetical protein